MGEKSTTEDQLFSKLVKPGAMPKAVRYGTIALAVVGAIATGLTAIYTINRVTQRPTESPVAPSTSPAIRGVTALGRIEPSGEVIQLSAPSTIEGARVAELLVTEGDVVRPNQVIAVLDSRDRLQAGLERAKKEVNVAQANLEVVRAGAKPGAISAQEATIERLRAELRGETEAQQKKIARLEAQLQEATKSQNAIVRRLEAELRSVEKELERYQQLAKNGAISKSELDNRRLQVETAREKLGEVKANRDEILSTLTEQLAEAKATLNKTVAVLTEQINEANATLEQIKEVRPVDIKRAEAEVESAIAAIGQAQAELELAYVRAPVAGRILKVHTRAGESVYREKGIADLGQTDQMIVIAEIYESDIKKVRLGQRVSITSETQAFEGELRGTVRKIGLQIGKKDVLDTDPAADVDARVVEVNIRLNPEDSPRVAGLTYSKVIVEIFL